MTRDDVGGRLPSFSVNSAIGMNIHVERNGAREIRVFRKAIVTVGNSNVSGAFAIHHMSCNMNIRHIFPLRSTGISSIRIVHGNGIHHTGLCCLHSHINGTTGIGRSV